ncbi:MAG: ATP-binding protein, partial [Rhodospirillales bacterium]|nr:ATP-binding protein [Rhodospirillales bacterium]
ELTKLARVRIDMPNALDDDWKIDVRKSSAHPPRNVRDRLRRIIETIGAGSRRVYSSRGKRLLDESRVPVWQRLQDKNEIRYRVNPEHPLLAEFMETLTAPMKRDFLAIIELTGAGLPVDSLFADIGSQPEAVAGSAMSPEAHQRAVEATYQHLIRSGLPASDVIDMLRSTEPFRSNWAQTESIIKTLTQETA